MIFFFRTICFFYLIIITIVLLIPIDFFVTTQLIQDKNQPSNNTSFIIHSVIFFILYSLFNLSFRSKKKILLFCVTYSILIESLQLFTSRGFQLGDIIFNFIGVIFAYFLLKKNIFN